MISPFGGGELPERQVKRENAMTRLIALLYSLLTDWHLL